MNLINNKIFYKILFLYSIIIIFFSSSNYITSFFTHNTTANILPGIAPHLNIGSPYKDYWDIYPPGIYLFYYLFFYLGKNSFLSYQILHLFLLFSTCYLAYIIFKTFFNNLIYYFISLSYFLSPLYLYYLLPNELVGIFFSYLGIYSFISIKNEKLQLFLSNFFLLYAGLIKEIFLLPALCILIFQILNKDFKYLKFTFASYLACVAIIGIYSWRLDILGEIFNSYEIKFLIFSEKITFQKSLFLAIPIVLIFLYFIKSYYLIVFKEKSLVLFLYSVLTITSFIILGYDDGGHFDLPKIFPIFFILSYLTNKFENNLQFIGLIIVIFVSGYFLKFQHATYSYLLINPFKEIASDYKFHELDEELIEIFQKEKPSVLYLYGWESTNFYYELELKPYSKYWIVNNQILTELQINELSNIIFESLPDYIYYCGYDSRCQAGLDFKTFEQNFINFNLLVEKCYQNLRLDIYQLKSQNCNFNS